MSDTNQLRIATFNAAMNRSTEGRLLEYLQNGEQPQIKNVAEIIQRTNPDIILLNEFDYDYTVADPLELPQLFLENYLNVQQHPDVEPVDYPYIYLAPSNTGIASGLDLDRNGVVVTEPESEGYGNDAKGFGNYPGQYAMVLFSQYPIVEDEVRTFQNFLWKDMPGARLPDNPETDEPNDWYSPEALEVLPLSSKSHWDVPINIDGEIVHVLASHPTPPVFDGEEDRNGLRNSDEIRFWADYVNPAKGDYIYDDEGGTGGLDLGKTFVIMGDQNADPYDGDSTAPAIMQLLDNPYIQGSPDEAPSSQGGIDATTRQGQANLNHIGNPAFDTGDFNPANPGNLRVDYVLPSQNLEINRSGVFWASPNDPLTGTIFDRLIGDFNGDLDREKYPEGFLSSDHRLVYLDVTSRDINKTQNRNLVTNIESLGMVTFPTGFEFKETEVGGLSGITYDAVNNIYYSISDDRSQINPARFYTLEIDLSDDSLDDGDVSFVDVTTLLDSNGNPFTPNSIDPEGIALTANNTLYIASEGNANSLIDPFVNQFGLDGYEIDGLTIPDKFLPTTEDFGIRNNLAFESATITPDGRFLYTAVEQALKQDGTGTTVDDTSYSRIIKYDLTTGKVVGEYVYEIEAIPQAPIPPDSFADNGLVELFALDNNGTLLAKERSFAIGVGNTVKLFQVQTQGALDVSDFDSLLLDEDTRYDIDPFVTKELLIDFEADLGIIPDNLEGMTFGETLADGSQSLILVSDNNFNDVQTTQVIALAIDIESIPAVLPIVETPYTIDQESGDAELFGDSDDMAVWIDPENAENSLVIGTLKDGGLAIFSLEGEILQTIPPFDTFPPIEVEFGEIRDNNVDLIYNFPIQSMIPDFEATVDLAIASDRENDTLAIFGINPETQQLYKFATPELDDPNFSIFGVDDGEATAYGLANYVSPIDGSFYVFVTQADGNQIAQLKLTTSSPADLPLIFAEVVRTIQLPVAEGKEAEDYQSEGIVVDQEQGIVYLAVEEELGIVKFDAEPDGSDEITIVRPIDSPELTPDLEGLALYYAGDGKGYLIASSQGDSSYAVYTRDGNNEYLGSFVIGDNDELGIDQANETDGLEVINVPLGSNFSNGGFFVQDGANEPQNAVENEDEIENNSTNFKFLRWDEVANAFATPLTIDTESYNPRGEEIVIEFTFEENFDSFRGNGFSPESGEGQLNSNLWIVKGFSDGDLDFGGTGTTGDFARGESTGGVESGGVYGFNVNSSDYIFGVQPAGSDFTPGEILLKLQNTGEETVKEVTISYDITHIPHVTL